MAEPVTRSRRLLATVTLLALLGAAAGCAAPGPAASPVATATVNLPPSYRYEPAAITVPAGTTVTWTNTDHFTHSVQLLDGGASAPLQMEPGQATSFTFVAPGTYPYQCSLHPQDMRGSVTVTP